MKVTKILKIIVAVVVLFGMGIVIGLVRNMEEGIKPTPTPQPKRQFLSQKIQPGNKLQTVQQELGEPIKQTPRDNYLIFEYDSPTSNRNHEVYLEEQEVEIIKEKIVKEDNVVQSDITEIYGEPEHILPESANNTGFNLYVYPEEGLAFRGHVEGKVLEIWYFKSTDIDNFIDRWAPDYSSDPSHAH